MPSPQCQQSIGQFRSLASGSAHTPDSLVTLPRGQGAMRADVETSDESRTGHDRAHRKIYCISRPPDVHAHTYAIVQLHKAYSKRSSNRNSPPGEWRKRLPSVSKSVPATGTSTGDLTITCVLFCLNVLLPGDDGGCLSF